MITPYSIHPTQYIRTTAVEQITGTTHNPTKIPMIKIPRKKLFIIPYPL